MRTEPLICQVCSREYFWKRGGGNLIYCNSCKARKQKRSKLIQAVEYKGGKCSRCGYNRSIAALSFHHVDPSQKKWDISYNYRIKWERLKEELDKCILLCSNCHDEVEYELQMARKSVRLDE